MRKKINFIRLIVYLFRFITIFVMKIPFNVIRVNYLRIFSKIGKQVFIGRNVEVYYPFNIEIGDYSVINKNCLLDGRGAKIKIGRNVDVAQDVFIWTAEHDMNDDNHQGISDDVIINDYVWIASRATILPGVTINKGAVIASGAVVTKDVNAMDVVGGVPARKISERHNSCTYCLADLI